MKMLFQNVLQLIFYSCISINKNWNILKLIQNSLHILNVTGEYLFWFSVNY